MSFEKRIMNCICHYRIMQNNSIALQILVIYPLIPFSPQPLATTDLFTIFFSLFFTVSLFPECYILWIVLYASFSNWLLSLSNMHLSFFHVFSRLDFLLALNNNPLSECTRVCLSIHLLKGILVASRFWHSWIMLLCASMCRFSVHISFPFIWINIKKHDC